MRQKEASRRSSLLIKIRATLANKEEDDLRDRERFMQIEGRREVTPEEGDLEGTKGLLKPHQRP